jgi:hypothetical protein
MKTILLLIFRSIVSLSTPLLLVVLLGAFSSCKKNDADPLVNLDKPSISAKWVVTGSNEYDSFEFNESGNYIVIKKLNFGSLISSIHPGSIFGGASREKTGIANGRVQDTNPSIRFGTYEIVNNTIQLAGLGTLTVTQINDNSISFSFQLTGNSNSITINATKQAEIASSSNTDLLCRTWKLVSINGSSPVGTEFDGLTILFSKAGTYFVTYADNNNEMAQWKWKNNAQTELMYTWDRDLWDEDDFVYINQLSLTSLKLTEYGETFEFKPIGN